MPPAWSIEMNRDPATGPANDTIPSAGARITVPKAAAMSMPRWPAPYGFAGSAYGRMTAPCTGHRYVPNPGPGVAAPTRVAPPDGGAPDRALEATDTTSPDGPDATCAA